MATMRIEHLLQHTAASSSPINRSQPRSPPPKRVLKPKPQQAPRPVLVVKTSPPAPPPLASSPIETPVSAYPKKDEWTPSRPRKRKSPTEEVLHAAETKSARLPRYSVNIFHNEPANAYPIANEGVVPRMVNYYLQVWAPQHGRALAFDGYPTPYSTLVFPYALQRAVLFESLIALSRAFWLIQEGLPWQKDSALAYHRNNAFAGLQLRLATEATASDDTTIMTIAALTTVDYAIGVHTGAVNHLNAMQRLRKIRTDLKGETPLQYFILIAMKAYDSLWGFVKARNEAVTSMAQLSIDSPMRSDLPSYPSLPFNIRVCEALSKVSTTFNDLAMQRELSVQMIDILANLSTLARLGRDGDTGPPTTAPSSPGGRNLLNTIADAHCFLSMSTTDVEHAICYGIIGTCFSLHFANKMIGDEFTETLQELQDTLSQPLRRQPKPSKNNKECSVWVMVAAAGALAQSEAFSMTTAVMDRAFELYPEDFAQWEKLDKILRKFLWNEALGKHWQRCWQMTMIRKSRSR